MGHRERTITIEVPKAVRTAGTVSWAGVRRDYGGAALPWRQLKDSAERVHRQGNGIMRFAPVSAVGPERRSGYRWVSAIHPWWSSNGRKAKSVRVRHRRRRLRCGMLKFIQALCKQPAQSGRPLRWRPGVAHARHAPRRTQDARAEAGTYLICVENRRPYGS